MVTLSSAEAEFVAASQAGQEAIYLSASATAGFQFPATRHVCLGCALVGPKWCTAELQENLYRKPHSVERSEAAGQKRKCISTYLFSLASMIKILPSGMMPSCRILWCLKLSIHRREEEERKRNRHVASCGS